MSSTAFARGDRAHDYNEAFRKVRACNDARHTFIISPDDEKRLAAAAVLEHQGAPDSLADSGAMYLEMAFSAEADEDTRLGFFDKARKNLEAATDRQPSAHDTSVAKARLYLNALPIFQSLLLLGDGGSLDVQHANYTANVAFANRLITHFDTLRAQDDTQREMRRRIVGSLGELSVLLLLQRHTIDELQDPEKLTLPSFFSEYGSATKGGSMNDTWDISFFGNADTEETFEPEHKIQVKANDNVRDTRMYADDIAIVKANRDLRVEGRDQSNRWPIFTIPEECDAEISNSENSKAASSLLDRRTGRLLDTISPIVDDD